MVAYSYKKRFVNPIRAGLYLLPIPEFPLGVPKLQTIRADRRRHARPSEELQHYCGMRTKDCFLIGRAECTSVSTIAIQIQRPRGRRQDMIVAYMGTFTGKRLDKFATWDGFADWSDMRSFWQEEHPDIFDFEGILIQWKPLV